MQAEGFWNFEAFYILRGTGLKGRVLAATWVNFYTLNAIRQHGNSCG